MFASQPNTAIADPVLPSTATTDRVAPPLETVDSLRLLHGHRELLIRHGDEVYRLRHTRNDKLILTK